ncbi:pseudouridine synthase [Dethiosulfovibrio sp. F2B]|uniref:pseudouridine synthase n=1 Tax=Dethiosulfovibrio faecalis TaxID=2720018 RepID=UPI001F2C0572|nr:pseudouridine synthase [Dethiosulfovibrio faecalis]MCF4150319.1 pseudouridine synthase [Dethiosulfovibrio faecalis]
MTVRLNRYLALCGVASRRRSEEILRSGRVKVGNVIVTDPAMDITEEDQVSVDGKSVCLQRSVYIVMNKPKGYVCAAEDRFYPTVVGLVSPDLMGKRIYPVGRLDRQSEGLLVLTNDGDFCNALIHPSAGYQKTYEVLLDRILTEEELSSWRKGVPINGRIVSPVSLRVMDRNPAGRWISIVLQEGLKREIRVMASYFSLSVGVLFRRKIGKMELRKLKSGEYCVVELQRLWRLIRQGGSV